MTTTLDAVHDAARTDTTTALAMLAHAGLITKTARAENLPDPLFVIADDLEVTFHCRTRDDLQTWATWLAEQITSSSLPDGRVHAETMATLWDIPLRLLWIERPAAKSVA